MGTQSPIEGRLGKDDRVFPRIAGIRFLHPLFPQARLPRWRRRFSLALLARVVVSVDSGSGDRADESLGVKELRVGE